ncbi:cytochrome oxidase small assembly protein [Cupriavidus sp. SK-3]|nr:cytochrome oxidase small assembly protein [Cupriavidus sp. SK-3]
MQDPNKSPSQADRKAANRRLGLILFSIVMVFFLGFFAKMIILG